MPRRAAAAQWTGRGGGISSPCRCGQLGRAVRSELSTRWGRPVAFGWGWIGSLPAIVSRSRRPLAPR